MTPRPTRNSNDASDLIAALLSNVSALHKEVSRLSGTSAGYMEKSRPCTVLPIAFIEKSKTRAREFGSFDRKIGYVVVKRMGRDRLAANTLLRIGLTRFSKL
jgi:hypothetical protein